MKKTNWILAAILTLGIFVLAGCGTTTVDLNKYVSIDVSGYNSLGEAYCYFDYDALNADLAGKIDLSKSGDTQLASRSFITGESPAEILMDECISYEMSKSSDLSNGDTVTLTWNCQDELAQNAFHCKLKHTDIDFAVEGLEDVGKFDPFDYLEVTFSGTDQDPDIYLDADSSKAEIQDIEFGYRTFDTPLKNGDTVTVTASVKGSLDQFASQYGCVLYPMEKKYEVNGLTAFAESAADIRQEDMDRMIQQGEDVFMSYVANNWADESKVNTFEYIGNYFQAYKHGSDNSQNYLELVYRCVSSREGESGTYTFYYPVVFSNLMVDENGACNVDLSKTTTTSNWAELGEGYWTYGFNSLDELFKKDIQSMIDNYTYEENFAEKAE